MFRGEFLDNILIDFDIVYFATDDVFYFDQVYDGSPVVFPTVCIQLISTVGLDALADELRKKDGDLPFFDYSGAHDEDGWYDFSINLNGYNDHHVDTSICAISNDDLHDYYIDLSDEEQAYIYQELNKQVDCEELLRQAADEMKDIAGGELTILPMKEV